VINSRRMKWAGQVSGIGEGRVVYRVLVGKPKREKETTGETQAQMGR